MKKKWLVVGMTLLLVPWLLASCGVAQELYDAVVAERDSLATKLQSAQSELDTTKSKLQSVQSELDTSKLEFESVQNEFTATKSELQSVQNELEELRNELAEIKEVYPPRDFSSVSELRDWLYLNTVSERMPSRTIQNWFAKALEVQEDALKDGYIISADIDYNEQTDEFSVICVAIIDGEYWAWDPQGDEPLHESRLGKVK